VSARYTVRPRADQDLDDQAFYLATNAQPAIGHRFLVAAHETFALLATHPEMGWQARLHHPELTSLRMFRISGFPKMLVFYLPRTDGIEVLRVVHGSRSLLALLRSEGVE
jgi:plasmid stabilization system protein ParE